MQYHTQALDGCDSTLPGVLALKTGLAYPRNALECPLQYTPVPSAFRGITLTEAQRSAAGFLRATQGAVIALDTGMGKTLTALAAIGELYTPIVVVAPLIAHRVWSAPDSDVARAFPHWKVVSLSTRSPHTMHFLDGATCYLINPEILTDWASHIRYGLQPRALIVDEADLVRGASTLAARALRVITRTPSLEYRIVLTATPINNRISDLYVPLDTAQPDAWGTKRQFVERYCAPVYTAYGVTEGGLSNGPELAHRLSRSLYSARRDGTRIKRVCHTIDVGCSVQDLEVKAQGRAATLVKITRYKRQLSARKATHAQHLIAQLVQRGRQVLALTWYKSTARTLAAAVNALAVIDSDSTVSERADAIDLIEAQMHARAGFDPDGGGDYWPGDAGWCIVATLGVASRALNELVACDTVVTVDLDWQPAAHLQAEGRIDRLNQQATDLEAHYVIGRGTIDEDIYAHITRKAELMRMQGDARADALASALASSDPITTFLDAIGA